MAEDSRAMIIDLGDGLCSSVETTAGLDSDSGTESSASTIDEVLAQIEQAKPTLIFFGVSDAKSDVLGLVERVAAAYPKIGLIISSNRNEPDVILNSMRAGADEFISEECSPEAFQSALQRVCRKKGIARSKESSGPGRVIAMFSGKGGCGTTLMAANLASNIAQLSRASVAVVDLDLQFGDMATMMDIQPKHSVAEVIAEDGSLDEDLLFQVMIEHPSGVYVMASPIDPADGECITPEHVSTMLGKLKERYSYIILDTSCSFSGCTLGALDAADEILVVTDTLVPSIRSAQRSLKVFNKLGYDSEKILLVVNRFDPQGDVGEAELSKAFEIPVFAIIPNDFKAATMAIDAGVPVAEVGEKSELAGALRSLAARFVEGAEEETKETVGLFGRLTKIMKKSD